MLFSTGDNNIFFYIMSQRQVHLSMLSWSYFSFALLEKKTNTMYW